MQNLVGQNSSLNIVTIRYFLTSLWNTILIGELFAILHLRENQSNKYNLDR